MAQLKAQTGFTIIELMVAVAVVSILLTVGVPAFGSLIERQQLSGAAQTFASDLRRAKSDAIAKGPGGSVTVTLASDSSAGTWSYAVTNSGSTPTKNVSQADFSGVTAVVTGWGVSGGAAAFPLRLSEACRRRGGFHHLHVGHRFPDGGTQSGRSRQGLLGNR